VNNIQRQNVFQLGMVAEFKRGNDPREVNAGFAPRAGEWDQARRWLIDPAAETRVLELKAAPTQSLRQAGAVGKVGLRSPGEASRREPDGPRR
jgi:hypothetical protein